MTHQHCAHPLLELLSCSIDYYCMYITIYALLRILYGIVCIRYAVSAVLITTSSCPGSFVVVMGCVSEDVRCLSSLLITCGSH